MADILQIARGRLLFWAILEYHKNGFRIVRYGMISGVVVDLSINPTLAMHARKCRRYLLNSDRGMHIRKSVMNEKDSASVELEVLMLLEMHTRSK